MIAQIRIIDYWKRIHLKQSQERSNKGQQQLRQQKPGQQHLQNTSSTIVTYSAASRDVQNNRSQERGRMGRGGLEREGYYLPQTSNNMM